MKILFVCSGNTCRSCMAEAIFNSICDIDDVEALSAGLSVFPGSKTSLNCSLIVNESLNLDISNRKAVQLNPFIIEQVDLVLTMTGYIRDVLRDTNSTHANKIYSLGEYIGSNFDISDPYGGSIDIYRKTFTELKSDLEVLLEKLKEDKGIR
ncbi:MULTISPECIES: low molecular weight protein arginine phosphatase [Clostridium]|uniref:low molecular weight protein arginine phosphatase n=1 Tax=Clostridium TaxID=1485 RepID=UPI00069D689F|nr:MULTISPECIES: low molecular weight protein arginine phosphatase [Clostridium]KOF57209.1 protein tyrosine phosphatase [Clostridium sp. DMHC 10]MCD2346983.1 low molecular weight protein arginine phosphatase [Clostridium guangxiense]